MKILYLKLLSYKRFPLRDIELFEHEFLNKLVLILGPNGSGKAQPLNSFIKVPNGWDLMKNMKVGTNIIARDGTVTKVTGVFPQGKKEIFKITFADGRTTRVTGDHLWKIYLSDNYPIRSKILTTFQMLNVINSNKLKTINKTFIWIDLPESEENKDKQLEIDPYILGVILGDGCVQGSIVITHPDEFIMNKIKTKLPSDLIVSVRKITEKNYCLTYSISGVSITNNNMLKGPGSNSLVTLLHKYNLMFKKSHEKFIPEEYLNGSTRQRLELLQGLMDTDGTIGLSGSASYCSTSYVLATQIQYLIRSLGGIASISIRTSCYTYNGKKLHGREAYQVNIRYKKPSELFTLPRKKERTNDNNQYATTLKLRVLSIEPDGIEESQCISIDHPDKLYITDNFIVTHNSSLLQELSPLPALKENFNKGGYKEIDIEKDNIVYRLISDFTTSIKYSFLRNEEELNVSGTITIQRELVYKYFNLTHDLFDILIGNQTFTNMSIPHRKKIFNKITHLNIDQILSKYNTLKEELKTQEMLLKTQLNVHQIESSKLLDKDKLASLKDNETLIKNNIELLLTIRENILKNKEDMSIDSVYTVFKNINARIKTFYDKYYIFLTAYPNGNYNELFTNYTSKKNIIEFKLQNNYTYLEKYNKELKIIELQNSNSLIDLEKQLNDNKVKIDNIINKLEIFVEIDKVKNISTPLYNLEIALLNIIHDIPSNENNKYSKDKYESLLHEKNEVLKKLDVLISNEIKANKELLHLQDYHSDGNMECPNCSHKWNVDYNKQLIEKIQSALTKIINDKLKLEEEKKSIDILIEENVKYLNLYREYSNIRNTTYQTLKSVWEKIDSSNYILLQPSKILNIIKLANMELGLIETIEEINKNNTEIESKIKLVSMSISSDKDWILFSIAEVNRDINNLLEEKYTIEAIITNLEISKKVNLMLNKLIEEFNINKASLHNTNMSLTVNNVSKEIDNELSILKVSLIELQTQISNYNNIAYLIDKYNKEIELTKTNIKALELILFALSPKHGLIAKTISGYLNNLIKYINNIIASIWEYKMVLKVIDVENENLDYKFKVQVEDKLTVPDVNKASAGMKEIIDLSFKLILYKLLNLEGYPLYLDELAARLDDVHRGKIHQLIFKLINDDSYSNIFLITHNDISYSNIKETEVITLI